MNNSVLNISIGANKTLTGYTQYPLRFIEQAIIDKYTPTLNQSGYKVNYFNFDIPASSFNKPPDQESIYQALNSDITKVLAQATSYNQLSKLVGLSNVTVSTKINWHLGTEFNIDGIKVHGYLREVGEPLRTEPLLKAVHVKNKLPSVDLVNRTLYDLVPGKLHAIHTDTLEDYGLFDNERHLYTTLNPSVADKINSMTSAQSKQYLNGRVGAYINVVRENKTELGIFYFCRHPDFLAGLAKSIEAIFVVNVITGVCTLYNSIKAISPSNRTSIRNHLYGNRVHNGIYRYIYASQFVKHFNKAKDSKEYTLTKKEVESLNDLFPVNNNK